MARLLDALPRSQLLTPVHTQRTEGLRGEVGRRGDGEGLKDKSDAPLQV